MYVLSVNLYEMPEFSGFFSIFVARMLEDSKVWQ